MGRTLPSITNAFLQEQGSLLRFRRALRLEDQRALDDLLAASRRHLAAAAYASHLLPFEIMLLAMLVEEHKEVMRLREWIGAHLPSQEGETRRLEGISSAIGAASQGSSESVVPPKAPPDE
jgi:hypothetical protein